MVMGVRQLFEFVTSTKFQTDEEVEAHLEEIQEQLVGGSSVVSNQDEVDEAVFQRTYIPRKLIEVRNTTKFYRVPVSDDSFHRPGHHIIVSSCSL